MTEKVFSGAVFMCHAPIVIPSIGGDRASQCKSTTEAMFAAAKEIVDKKPDRVIVLDPHLVTSPSAYTCVDTPRGICCSFKAFGRPDLGAEFPSETDFYKYLAQTAAENQLAIDIKDVEDLDHGASVPLWFLQAAGYKGAVCVLGFPWRASQEAHTRFGKFLRLACGKYEGRTAIIASGDMSHRLQHGAPSGFHPKAHTFDKTFKELVEGGKLAEASQLPVDLRDLAAEDSSESMAIAAGALGANVTTTKLLSYEAPFGVGYLVAVLG
jgi:aromatic ring-opening dioxygenase LigB subunit